MRYLITLPVLFAAALVATGKAQAEPAWGRNCVSCHGGLYTDLLFAFGEDGTADPDESATGAPDRGTLKVYQAQRDTVKSLQAAVMGLAVGDTYAVELKGFRFPGVVGGGRLSHTPDCDWPQWGETSFYYTEPFIAYQWGTDPTSFVFNIDVAADADLDYYELTFAIAGRFGDTGELFYGEESFYLQVVQGTVITGRPIVSQMRNGNGLPVAQLKRTPASGGNGLQVSVSPAKPRQIRGDFDGDGDIDGVDYMLFNQCLYGTQAGHAQPDCSLGDFDNDGDIDLKDAERFESRLILQSRKR